MDKNDPDGPGNQCGRAISNQWLYVTLPLGHRSYRLQPGSGGRFSIPKPFREKLRGRYEITITTSPISLRPLMPVSTLHRYGYFYTTA